VPGTKLECCPRDREVRVVPALPGSGGNLNIPCREWTVPGAVLFGIFLAVRLAKTSCSNNVCSFVSQCQCAGFLFFLFFLHTAKLRQFRKHSLRNCNIYMKISHGLLYETKRKIQAPSTRERHSHMTYQFMYVTNDLRII
jgi:hypothetical protein